MKWSFQRTLIATLLPLPMARRIDEMLFGHFATFAIYQSLNVVCVLSLWLILFDVIPEELAFTFAVLYVALMAIWMTCQHDLAILRNLIRHDLYVIANVFLSTTAGVSLCFIMGSGWRGVSLAVLIAFAGVPTVTIDCQCENMRKDAFYWMIATATLLVVLIVSSWLLSNNDLSELTPPPNRY